MNVTIFKNIKATSAGFVRHVDLVFERIQNGKSEKLIEQIRSEADKEKRNELKQQLPSICFSGSFKSRSKSGLRQHSGLICLDFDKIPTPEERDALKAELAKDEYVFSVFISPSGDGLKVIVKIPAEVENHEAYFESLGEHFASPYFDIATKDVSRVCYESFDPEIVINPDALIWSHKKEKEETDIGTFHPILPVTSDNQIIQNLLKWWTKNYGMNKGSRNSNLFKLAASFNDFGITESEAERVCEQFEQEDFKSNEIHTVVKSAYRNGRNNFGTKFFEDKRAKEKIEKAIRNGVSGKELETHFNTFAPEQITAAVTQIKQELTVTDFWEYDENNKIKIVPHKLKNYLEQEQFFKYYPTGSMQFIFIRVVQNQVEAVSNTQIKDFVLSELLNRKDIGYQAYDYVASYTKLFKDDYLSLLSSIELPILRDDEKTCYLYFRNCAVKITSDATEEIDYLNLDGYVWKNQVINRDYHYLSYAPPKAGEKSNCMYYSFVWLISGQQNDRFKSLISVIGYLLHSHKTSANNKAIILNDEIISENPNGGSGKGLFFRAISYLKKVSVLDGKQFDQTKSFPYQTVGIDTQILLFDDVKKNFNFEGLFSLITEGITLERKNKDAIFIPVGESPKIGITTNYTVGGAGGSFDRRKFEIELSAHFSATHTPEKEFGRMLFEDWDESEWNRFISFMVDCVKIYLRYGLIKSSYKNLEARKFIKETSFEFYEYVTEEDCPIQPSIKLYTSEQLTHFVQVYPDRQKWESAKRWKGNLEKLAIYKGWKMQSGKDMGGRFVRFEK